MTSLSATEALVRRLRSTLARGLPTKNLLINRKSIGRPSRRNFTRWLTSTCIASTCIGRADDALRFFSRILNNARLSAERSLFSSSESSANSSSANSSYSHSSTAVQPAGLLSAKRISLFRFVISVIIDSSSEIAAERFLFEMFLTAPSTKSCKEMLNSYCTLFPLKVKEFEAFDSVFSFLSCDCVTASLSARSRLKAANF